MFKSIWKSIQDDPVFMRKVHGWLTLQWIVHFPIVICLYFFAHDMWVRISILYLALVSIYANVAGHLGAWQGARVEVAQNKDANVQDVLDALDVQSPST